MNRTTFAGLAAASLVATGLALGQSGASARPIDDNPQGSGVSKATALATAISCDGEQNVNMRSRIVNVPFTFSETATNAEDQAVPGAGLTVKGPRRGRDTLLITYSAETQLSGGETFDWMGLEVHKNGNPIEPFTAAGDVLAFTSEPSWNANSMQFCTKIGPGLHTLQVYANLQDNGADNALGGWLDDYTFSVVRYN
jgi:hypothetical protein